MAESGRQALVLQVADLVRVVDNAHLLACFADLDTDTLTRMAKVLTHRRVLCAHADDNGVGAHWKNEGEPCTVGVRAEEPHR